MTWPVETGWPGSTESSETVPARGAVISFSIFIASTTQTTWPGRDLVALGDLDREHGALHRRDDRVARGAVVACPVRRGRGGGGRARRAEAPARGA